MKKIGGIYGITSREFGMTHEESALVFLEGGVRILQYREKRADTRIMIDEAARIKALCKEYGATFIVNDNIDVASAVDADGVHLGQDDAPIGLALRLFPDRIVGISAKTPEEAIGAEKRGAAYLGVGSIFPTATKGNDRVIGIDGFREVRKSTGLPIVCIGGLRIEHVKTLKKEGADGIAIISSVLGAGDPVGAARAFVKEWERA